MRFSEMTTGGGYNAAEVASALQKTIRRGLEREALHWASELDQAGYGNYVFKRLRIIASEELWENWVDARKAKDDPANAAIFLCHAVVVLARAKKSRLVDHALMVGWEAARLTIEIPDYALDRHTARGRQLGRGQDHFFEEGARLENEGEVDDPYAGEGRLVRSGPKRPPSGQLEIDG